MTPEEIKKTFTTLQLQTEEQRQSLVSRLIPQKPSTSKVEVRVTNNTSGKAVSPSSANA